MNPGRDRPDPLQEWFPWKEEMKQSPESRTLGCSPDGIISHFYYVVTKKSS